MQYQISSLPLLANLPKATITLNPRDILWTYNLDLQSLGVPHSVFKEYIIYDQGRVFSFRCNRFMSVSNGTDGYLVINLCHNKEKKQHRIHRLVADTFLPNPDGLTHVDHINRLRTDNCVGNLRWVTAQENQFNRSSSKGSTSKYLGVRWNKSRNKWVAQIKVNGKQHHLGYFTQEDDAAEAYKTAKLTLHHTQ
ncbi:AP2 domain-containing protein [Hymenobacter volaticus]|uniref:AP2 domain-containing protein n=1 Tax=Hymenobacter volaticus TaxID=2932254 RepID=UPI001FD6A7EA|nr:AP2 domain-containing protein [Hymenobacter volaticus]